MKKSHVLLVFTFLLLIPYVCSLLIIGIGYNALVLHSAELYRTIIGALVGSIIMFAVKATIQRPVDLLAMQTNDGLLKQLLRFFSIRRRYFLLFANIVLDFILCFASTYLVLGINFRSNSRQLNWICTIDYVCVNLSWSLCRIR